VTASVKNSEQKRVLTGLKCSSCGGGVDVQEGLTNVVCRYCGTPQAVVGQRGIVRVMVLNTLEREAASRAVRNWFSKGIRKEPALKKEARFQEAFLAWFPFVRARLDAVGWLLGIRERKRKRGKHWETVREPVEIAVEQSLDLTMPAADMGEFGVHRIDLTGDEVRPLDDELLRSRGMVFRPSRSLEETATELSERALENISRSNRLDHVSFSWLATVRRRVALVYYPMWVVRYGFRGQTYQVLVDAEGGGVAYGKAPGNHLYRAFSLVAATAGACFVGTTILQHASGLLQSENGLIGLGVVGLALAGLVYWGYSQFRHGGVVEEGTGLADDLAHQTLTATVEDVVRKFK
jgi:predicted RNA-binding Zn-ribbon protein involved in translation (DUF1610 family)